MHPIDVIYAIGLSGYINKDFEAARQNEDNNTSLTLVRPVTPGFKQAVQAGNVISIMLRLPNGTVAIGECADVIFSGAASRDPLFVPEQHLPVLENVVRPWLLECDVSSFRAQSYWVDTLRVDGVRLHSAVRYGLSQALLSATALVHHCTVAEVIAREWSRSIQERPIDILVSCHRGDQLQLERMIMKRAALLPHASFVHVDDLGVNGSKLLSYIAAVAKSVSRLGARDYHPRLHFDVYGTLGDFFDRAGDENELLSFFEKLAQAAGPYELLIESPIIAPTKAEQLKRLSQLRQQLARRGIRVKLVADEWCNTLDDIKDFVDASATDYVQIKTPDLGGLENSIEAVLYCQAQGVGSCLGGSGNETDVSARITAQIALATGPDFLLAKPGIGGDESLMIMTNEMIRTLALVRNWREVRK